MLFNYWPLDTRVKRCEMRSISHRVPLLRQLASMEIPLFTASRWEAGWLARLGVPLPRMSRLNIPVNERNPASPINA